MRECGKCSMCCKLLHVKSMDSPAGKWCESCDVGKGCSIYDERPGECRRFKCLWLLSEKMPLEFRPDKVKAVVTGNKGSDRLIVHLDTSVKDIDQLGESRFGKALRNIAKNEEIIVHEIGGRGRNLRIGKAA